MFALPFVLLFLIQGAIGWWGCHVWRKPYRSIAMLGVVGLAELLFLAVAFLLISGSLFVGIASDFSAP